MVLLRLHFVFRNLLILLDSHPNGINNNINISSQGNSQPVTTSCNDVNSKAMLIACLQPDRRVTLNIIGVKDIQIK